jgi:predicted DCC family thiol-disulfide oxidoreductase YuxK
VKLPPHVNINDKVILFDGVCRLCNGWVRFLIKYDKQGLFKFCSAQSAEGQAILQWLGLPTDTFETMLLIEGETAYTKSDAFLRVVGQLPQPWRSLIMLKVIPKGIRDRAYDRIALNRYRLFGRYEQCMVPSEENKKRFLGYD